MRLDELDYVLPERLIAQAPLARRDGARMLVLEQGTGRIEHSQVRALSEQLPARSLLVVNDTKVIPARLIGAKPTGGRVELLLVEELEPLGEERRWLVMGRASKGLREGMEIQFGDALRARVHRRGEGGFAEVVFHPDEGFEEAIERIGQVPLPPYIRREPIAADRDRYQTVFADRAGAVAAPTAGLHLSEPLLAEIRDRGHEIARVTLHVGPGTFLPVKGDALDGHKMHEERYEIRREVARRVMDWRAQGRPVVAVGTTVVRALESAASADGLASGAHRTRLFVRPPYEFRVVDALLTNFHLPRSTLLALVMAFGGVQAVREAYSSAVDAEYRFFSYGDAMLIRRAPS